MIPNSAGPPTEPAGVWNAAKMSTPGAVTSGFSWSETGVGPPEEKSAITFARPLRVVETAPTVIASGVEPGEATEPLPKPEKSFPAATTGTTPARAAAWPGTTERTTAQKRAL